jgi:hypothetical protein
MTNRPDYEIAREELSALMVKRGIRIESTFIPWSKSRNAPGSDSSFAFDAKSRAKGWRSLNWRVRVERGNPGQYPPVLETDYAQGEGHCPAVKHMAMPGPQHRKPHCLDWDKAVMYELENGREYSFLFQNGRGKPILPPEVDVFACIVGDGYEAINAGSFEDWADNFGLDTDSRKAEKTYNEALRHGLAMRAAFGETFLSEAAELASRL